MKAGILIITLALLISCCYSAEVEMGIYYQDGTFQRGDVRLHKPLLGVRYLTINDSTRVDLQYVKKYVNDEGVYLKVSDLMGSPQFAMRIIKGKISVYSYIETNMQYTGNSGIGMGGGGWTSSSREVLYCTVGNDSVFTLTHSNLKPIVSDNPRCVKIMESSKTTKTIKYLGYAIVATGLIVVVSMIPKEETSEPPAGVKAGIGIAAAGIIVSFIAGQSERMYLFKAIDAYNK